MRLSARAMLVLFAALIAFALATAPSRAPAAQASFVHLRIDGVINPIEVRHLRGAIERAERDGASFVVVSIDTPGGLVSSMQEICAAITNAKVPVIGFVEPAAAQATSAGAFILLATDVAAMAPSTHVGAAHPVGPGENLEGAMNDKATNSLAALAKSLATRRNRPANIAEEIVRQSSSFTAEEAHELGLVEILAPDLGTLLAELDGRALDFPDRKTTLETRGAIAVEQPMSWANRALDAIADPTITSILLMLGVLGILYELSSPGIGAAGIVGVVSLLLGLVSASVLPIEAGGPLLLLVGFAAIAVEIKVPSKGLLAAGGIAAIILGALFLVDESEYFGAVQRVEWRIFAPLAISTTVLVVAIAGVASRALRAKPLSGIEALVGKSGHANGAFAAAGERWQGTAFVDGARWTALSREPLADGEELRVVAVLSTPTRLEVERTAASDHQ